MTTPKSRLPIYKQPFIHFMLGGLAIFLFSSLRGESSAGDDKIIVTVPQVERMAGLWTQTWQRPPSEAELQGLVRDHIKEEVYYREALKLGLDVNDTVIRRRLRQKMEDHTFKNGEDEIKLTASMGCAIIVEGRSLMDGRSLVRHADHGLYQSKEQGRNKVTFTEVQDKSTNINEQSAEKRQK